MFLEIMADARDISSHFGTVSEPDSRNLAQSRIWFLGSSGAYLQTDAPLKWAVASGRSVLNCVGNIFERRGFGFPASGLSGFSFELVDCRHIGIKNK